MKIRKFDTKVQHLKYKVLREVAREAWRGNLINSLYDLPEKRPEILASTPVSFSTYMEIHLFFIVSIIISS